MPLATYLDQLHFRVRANRWLGFFAVFSRVVLALGFIPSGMVKILGERFTALPSLHPMGQYLDALYHTGYYYTFIGILQVTAAVLLLIPRTVTLGALLYLPIILNICILSFAVRFDGSMITAPLMVLANLYLLCWDYHKLKYLLPFRHPSLAQALPKAEERHFQFPWAFFGGVGLTMVLVVAFFVKGHELMPRNSAKECLVQCPDASRSRACAEFCSCIHAEGLPLKACLERYYAQ